MLYPIAGRDGRIRITSEPEDGDTDDNARPLFSHPTSRTAERRRERDAYIVFSVLNTLRDIDRHDLLYLLEWESDYLDKVLADLGAMLNEVREASST